MNFQKKKLKNGMTLLFESRDLPLASVSISNPFGAAHEPSEIKGIAHFIEHLLFTGTKKRTHEDISRDVEKKGGVLNAFTNENITSFLFKLPSEHILAGLEILADMLNNTLFDPEKFEKEKRVIIEEIKMYKDNPRDFVWDLAQKAMFEPPFGEGVIGSEETILKLSRDFVANYFKEKYNPKNFIVTIVGNANIEEIEKFLEENFSPREEEYQPLELKQKSARIIEERESIDQAQFVLGMHAPMANDENRYVLEILNAYLADGMSSRLFLEIREKRGLAYSVAGHISMEKSYSQYCIYVGTTKPALEQVESLIKEEFNNIDTMSPQDLKEAKKRVLGLHKVKSESSINVMAELVYEEIATGNAQSYYNLEKNISSITLDQVKSLAKNLIKEYSVAIIAPK